MKRRGRIIKILAELCLLFGLLAFLLPFMQIKNEEKTTKISGFEMIKIGVDAGVTHHRKGAIPNDYVIKDTLTWGDLKAGANYVSSHDRLRQIEIAAVVCALPIIFSVLALLFLLMASYKPGMYLPTFFAILSLVGGLFLSAALPAVQNYIGKNTAAGAPELAWLIGFFGFLILTGAAVIILMLGWLTGSYDRSVKEIYRNGSRDDDDDDDSNHRRRKKKRKKKSKSKSKKKKDKKEQKNTEERKTAAAIGRVQGLSGMYKGERFDLLHMRTVRLGTTIEAADCLRNGSMHDMQKIENHTFTIYFDESSKSYTVSSQAVENILIKSVSGEKSVLRKGMTERLNTPALLQVGNQNAVIKLQ